MGNMMKRGFCAIGLALFTLLGPSPLAADVQFSVSSGSEQLEERLRGASALLPFENPASLPSQDVIAAARSEYGRLVAVLYERGYFGPVVSVRLDGREASAISPFRPAAPIQTVTVQVDPGPLFHLGSASIAPLAQGTTLPEGFSSGAVAGTPILRQAAEAGIDAWRLQGHAAANISNQSVVARHAAAELDVDIEVSPGPLAYFGSLQTSGQERMRLDRILAIAGLPEGEQFDPRTVQRVAQRLRSTGAFSSVALTESAIDDDGSLDIEADLVEAPLRRIGFGAELSANEGAGLSAYWLHRNLFGGAERLRLDGEVTGLGGQNGGFDAQFSAVYSRPATFTPDTVAEFAFRLEHLDEVTFTEDSVELSAGLSHRFSDTFSASGAVELSYSDVSDGFSNREVTILSTPFEVIWDRRDDPLDAREGWYLQGDITPFSIFEDTGGARFSFDGRGYIGFGEDNRTRLAGRLQLGTIEGGSIATLPPDWLFFSGGADTVRGQDYQSLGAMQAGVLTGGRSFIGTSVELRQDLFGNFGGVLFFDAGYVTSGSYWSGSDDWHSGAGIGIRYDTPIGQIRLDVATPTSGANSGQDLSLYIGIGQSF